MTDISISVKCSFTVKSDEERVQSGIYANFFVDQHFFPCHVVSCKKVEDAENQRTLIIEVLLGEVNVDVSAGTEFKLHRGPNILLGLGEVISIL